LYHIIAMYINHSKICLELVLFTLYHQHCFFIFKYLKLERIVTGINITTNVGNTVTKSNVRGNNCRLDNVQSSWQCGELETS
jgi:hypothetical protein